MQSEKNGIEDLVEFYNQWPELRVQVQDILMGNALEPEQKEIIRSMMHVVDCVGPADFAGD